MNPHEEPLRAGLTCMSVMSEDDNQCQGDRAGVSPGRTAEAGSRDRENTGRAGIIGVTSAHDGLSVNM